MKNVKFNKVLVTVGALLCVYNAGVIIGHMKCMKNIMKKYGDDIKDDKLVDNVNNSFTITLHKFDDKGE